MKNKNGITLIALIITIIILLILAMVTIRILMNQGIIKHAQNATAAYNDAQNNETEYLTYAEGEMDKYAGVSSGGEDQADEDLDLLRRYFLGVNQDGSIGQGQDISIVANMDELIGMYPVSCKDNETITNASTSVTGLHTYIYNVDVTYVYVRYNNKEYRVTLNAAINEEKTGYTYTTNSVNLVYTPDAEGIEGTTRTYNGEQWTVLYNKGNTVEIVSPSSIGRYTLGANDPNGTGNTEVERAVDSYNNAISRLNNFCKTTLNDDTARSVGSDPSNPNNDTTNYYSSVNTENLSAYNNHVGKVEDNNAEQDYARMCYWGIEDSTDNKSYWMASRVIIDYSGYASFGIRNVDNFWNWFSLNDLDLYRVDSSGASINYRPTQSVRAIVTVNK